MSPTEMVKLLREQTGVGMMDCKTALAQSAWDMDKAVDFLRQKGLAAAGKKAGRATQAGVVGTYIHAGGKIGVLVEVNCETDFVGRNVEFQDLVRDIAMQVAGASPVPRYIRREEVAADVIAKEEAIYLAQAKEAKKPEAVLQKIVAGKVDKFLQEICLLEQKFIKNPDVTIQELVSQKVAKLGENIQVCRFTRYQLGETETV
jgi:elongation factor Ts